MKKIIALFMIISLFSVSSEALGAVKDKTVQLVQDVKKSTYTYLVLGLDEAAGNTDVIMLFSYNGDKNSYSVLGIPRDSYFNKVNPPSKINGYVSSSAAGEKVDLTHITSFTAALSSALGVNIDGTVAYSMSALRGIVDAVGGVTLNVPMDISGIDSDGVKIEIPAGKRNLNGKEAVFFIRHRASYPTGDLGRMDVQRVFVSAFIDKLKTELNPEMAIRLLTHRDDGILTDINTSEMIMFTLKNIMKMKDADGLFAALPGKAEMSDGISYYSVNKKASDRLLDEMDFIRISEFDNEEAFKSKDASLSNVYYSSDVNYRIFTDDELN